MNRSALFTDFVVGALLGMLPYAAFVDSPSFAIVYTGGILIAGLGLAIWHIAAENEPPRAEEHAHAILGVAAYSGSIAIFGLMLYGIAFWLTQAVGLLSDWLHLSLNVTPRFVALWASGPATLLFGLAPVVSPIPRCLYPDVHGVVSSFDGLIRRRTLRWNIPVVLTGVAITLATYFVWPAHWGAYIIALLIIVGGGAQSMNAANEWSPVAALGSEVKQAIEKLFRILGYEIAISPRTEEVNADVDSLLKTADMFAKHEENAFLIQLKTPMRINRPVSAADAAFLPVAAGALSLYLSKESRAPVRVQPMLVLVGREMTDELALLAREEKIRVLFLTEEAVREVLRCEDEAQLRQLAQQYLPASPAVASTDGARGSEPSPAA